MGKRKRRKNEKDKDGPLQFAGLSVMSPVLHLGLDRARKEQM
jgi:hypothetical protein